MSESETKDDPLSRSSTGDGMMDEKVDAIDPQITLIQCGCGAHNKCEHEWGGWRAFDDGRGGEQVCKKCGMGAMAHTLSLDW